MGGTILDQIVQTKHEELSILLKKQPMEEIKQRAYSAVAARPFRAVLRKSTVSVIAEIKRSSPSAGIIRQDFDPVVIARDYEKGGAAAISVLTDERYFHGNLESLKAVHSAVSLPVLRKDFIIDPYQIFEARAAGADCVLLITAILTETEVREFHALACELGMDALVEVHTAAEMDSALRIGANLIGINNRNLHTFDTHIETTLERIAGVPSSTVVAALSGISSRHDVEIMAASGVDAVLVGEALMRQADVSAAVQFLCNVPGKPRLGCSEGVL